MRINWADEEDFPNQFELWQANCPPLIDEPEVKKSPHGRVPRLKTIDAAHSAE